MIHRRWRVIGEFGLAREFEDFTLDTAITFQTRELVWRHRDLTLMGLVQFSALPGLWLTAGSGFIQARVREADADVTLRTDAVDNPQRANTFEGTRTGPWRTDSSRWVIPITFGADGAIPVVDRVRIVPAIRFSLFEHDPFGYPAPQYGLGNYTVRLTLGAEFGL
jgi:hypothetical protein